MVEATLHLPWAPSSASLARRFVRLALLEQDCDASFVDDVTILTGELMANAVLHALPVADGQIQLRQQHAPEGVRIEIGDGSPSLPAVRPVDTGGRGLHLVEALATRWGTIPDNAGKAVWFELKHQ